MQATAQSGASSPAVAMEIGAAARHTFVYTLGSLVTKAIGFLLLPLYTHYLRPEDYGALEVLDLTMSLIGMLLNVGIMAAVLRYYAAGRSIAERRKIIGSAFLAMLAIGVAIGTLGFALLPQAAPLLFGPKIPLIYVALCFGSFLLNHVVIVPYTYLRAEEASGMLVAVDILASGATIALTVYCVAALKWSLYGVLWSALIIAAIRAPLLIWWMIRKVGIDFDRGALLQLARFGAPLVFSNLAMFVLNFSDRFFLQRLRSLEVVGVYAAGYKFPFLLNFVFIQSFNMMWQARMYIIEKQPDSENTFAQVFALYFVFLSVAALGLSLFSGDIVRLMLDPHYAAAGQVMPVVSLAYVCLAIGSYLQLGMYLSCRTGLIGVLCAGAAILSIGLNYVLISLYGMLGAAWATVGGFGLLGAGSYYCSQSAYPLKLKIGGVIRGLLIGIALYIVSVQLANFHVWIRLGSKLLLLTLFPVALRATRVLSHQEITTIASLCSHGIHSANRFLRRGLIAS